MSVGLARHRNKQTIVITQSVSQFRNRLYVQIMKDAINSKPIVDFDNSAYPAF
jgi:hypothetical protein